MKYTIQSTIAAATLFAAGCASNNLPRSARVVGGGLKIDYSSELPGTAVLIEKTTGKTVACQTVDNASFTFDASTERDAEILQTVFGTNGVPANAQFLLYFVPSPKKN
jgi:hypothetical protein